MGKAIIAPDQPNIRELLDHQRTGLLFASSDPEGMPKSLVRLIGDKDLREALGQGAATEVRHRPLTWASNATRVIGILQGLSKTGA